MSYRIIHLVSFPNLKNEVALFVARDSDKPPIMSSSDAYAHTHSLIPPQGLALAHVPFAPPQHVKPASAGTILVQD